jgi:hypothetical protein
MNNKKNNSNSLIYTFLILFFIIILIIVIIVIISKFSKIDDVESEMHEYTILTPIKDKSTNMNNCLEGCVRGTCNKTNSKDSCKYDFQCQYCNDLKTSMFYVNYDNEREIIPVYEEEDKLTNKQKNKLNESIINNNIYIKQLNDKIKMMNS